MLIDLSQFSPVCIDPSQYPTTLAVRIDTADRPECGVFAGKHQDFHLDEEGKRVALEIDNGDEDGSRVFILDRPAPCAKDSLIARWSYSAIGWDTGIYVEHPVVYLLTLEEHNGGPKNYFWSVGFRSSIGRFNLILPDYEPGFSYK